MKSIDQRREYDKQRYWADPIAGRARTNRWRLANPDHEPTAAQRERKRERERQNRLANLAKYRERSRLYYQTNIDERRKVYRARAKRLRETNPERAREAALRWYQANIPRHLEKCARRRSRGKSAMPGWLKATGQLDQMRQFYANARSIGLHVDHDIPIAGCIDCGATGLHVLANLQLMDGATNKSKGRRCTECFIAYLRTSR